MGAFLLVFRATRFTSFRAKIWGPRGILCTRGEKAHTSKRVSIIACNNVISKAKCAPRTLGFFRTRRENHNLIKFSPFYRRRGPQKILLYFWGEGANEQKTNKRIKRVCLVKRKICDAYAPSHEPVKNPRGPHKILCTCGAKWHQNSAVLGELIFSTQNGAFLLVFYSALLFATDMRESHL